MAWCTATGAITNTMLVLVMVMTSGSRGLPAFDSVESVLYLIFTSRCNFPSIGLTTSVNNLPRF